MLCRAQSARLPLTRRLNWPVWILISLTSLRGARAARIYRKSHFVGQMAITRL
jgi:hypothetical protein